MPNLSGKRSLKSKNKLSSPFVFINLHRPLSEKLPCVGNSEFILDMKSMSYHKIRYS